MISEWLEPGENEKNIAWTKDTYTAMERFYAAGAYSNYLTADEGPARVQAAYGINFERLQTLKDRYDPENLFHLNQNVPPSA